MTASAASTRTPGRGASGPRVHRGLRDLLVNPWGEARFLWVVGIGYVLWSLLPIAFAVLFSFNTGRSISSWQGFSLRWYVGDPDESVWHDAALRHSVVQSLKLAGLTMIFATLLGLGFALALDRWRGRGSGSANIVMMFSFITPELVLAVALFLLFINLFKFVGLGTPAQLLGLITLAVAYAVVIVRARLLSVGREYEEAAMDLGASPIQAIRRVLLPLMYPAIFASAAIIFAFTLDDFVMANALSLDSSTETVAIKIYGAARTGPTPAANALGTLMLVTSTVVIVLAVIVYRRLTAGERRGAPGPDPLRRLTGRPRRRDPRGEGPSSLHDASPRA